MQFLTVAGHELNNFADLLGMISLSIKINKHVLLFKQSAHECACSMSSCEMHLTFEAHCVFRLIFIVCKAFKVNPIIIKMN